VTLHPTAGGIRQGTLVFTAPGALGTETLVDNYSFAGSALAQAEWTEHRLVYATSPLTAPVHISGIPRVTIRIAADRPAANLSVWLVALPFAGTRDNPLASLITRGWADPQNHAALDRSTPLVTGQFYDVRFDLQPDDQVIPAGKRIALMVFSSDREFTLRPDPGAKLTLALDGTTLVLPVVGGEAALRQALGQER
jgi:X-Pro dipeptidyl-peptidase